MSDDAVVKRTVRIAGHVTSVSVEAPFWDALKDIARRRGLTLNGLVAAIDAERSTANLSSAIRLAVLAHYKAAAEAAAQPPQGASG